jgi:hypothetical protein
MKAKVGPNTSVPIANGKTAPAVSGPTPTAPGFGPSADPNPGGKSGGGRHPNKTLVAPTIATPGGTDAENTRHPNQN